VLVLIALLFRLLLAMPGSALARRAETHASLLPDTQRILSFTELQHVAKDLAKTDLVPRGLKGKPDAIVLVGMKGAELGLTLVNALGEIDVINNKPVPCGQLKIGLIRAAGHDVHWIETTDEKAVIKGRRRENRKDVDGWLTVTWTIEQARKAGLTDRWVEQKVPDGKWSDGNTKYRVDEWVVGNDLGIFDASERARLGLPKVFPEWAQEKLDAGEIKAKDNWQKYTADMLRARAASTLARMEFSDVLVGLSIPVEDFDSDLDVDLSEPLITHDASADYDTGPKDIHDADVVEERPPAPDRAPGADEAVGAASPTPQEPAGWKDRAKAAGIRQADLIRQAQDIAGELKLEAPLSLAAITDPELCGRLGAWLDEQARAA
jgi:hypothetical protein